MKRRLLRQFVNDDLSSKEHVTNWMGHIFLPAEIYETISTVPLSPDNIPAWKTCKRRLRNGRKPTLLEMSFFAYARRQNPTAKTAHCKLKLTEVSLLIKVKVMMSMTPEKPHLTSFFSSIRELPRKEYYPSKATLLFWMQHT